MSTRSLRLLLTLTMLGLSFVDLVASTHFRGAIIMTRPQPGGEPYQVEISYRISWRRSYVSGSITHYCDSSTIDSRQLRNGQDSIDCQYGCFGTITQMPYFCTSFSDATVEDWTFGENQLVYNFAFAAGNVLTIGTTGRDWISPFSSDWNVSTTFSLMIRNDTGRINSTPRSITSPVIRLQEGCNHSIILAVSDPDGDIVRCRWGQGRECAGICGGFPGAYLYYNTCTIEYQADRGARYWAAAVMIEDFLPESSVPLSSVALQFLVLVVSSTEPCSQKPRFVQPTLRRGSCVAIPPETTFVTQLIADVGDGSDASIMELQVVPPIGTRVGELTQISASNNSYVNVTWTPTANQQNQTHLLCFIAVRSDSLASDQVCIDLLPGYFPPAPIQMTAVPNQQLVHPSNTTWRITFDMAIKRPSLAAYIRFFEYHTEDEIYSIDASISQSQDLEVMFEEPNEISITPNFLFEEKTRFYITFDRGVVKGTEECGPENEPLVDKNFWTFETMDVTPPSITFLENPLLTNANVSFSWESNENVTWECVLVQSAIESAINCSDAYWRQYSLIEGPYTLIVRATDEAGNTATVAHMFEVDLTPPTVDLITTPSIVSNEQAGTFTFSCNETCSFECQFLSINTTQEISSPCNDGSFVTPTLQSNTQYTLIVTPTDQVGNTGQGASFTWETDFDDPQIFGIQNISISCTQTDPEYTGQPQIMDNRPERVSLMYSDYQNGCFIRRTWTATDRAGNTAQMIQIINLEFSPTVSLLPQVDLPCDSTSTSSEVSNSTAYAQNPCGLPLQLIYEDSEYICPGTFARNWTANVCGNSANASQIVRSYDLCPPHACGRNESTPRGICSLGQCQCNQPWYGENCSALIYEPVAHPINNSILIEAEEYMATVALSQGTPPFTWLLISGPEDLLVDQYTGRVMWNRAQPGNHSIVVQIENEIGSTQVEWSLLVTPGYNASLLPISPSIFPYVQPVVLQGYVEYETDYVYQGDALPINIDIFSDETVKTLRTYTTINNSFSLTFYPLSTEYGTYTAGARHPNSMQLFPQVEWGILGMRSESQTITLNGEAIRDFENTFYNATVIYNDGPGPLNGLTATPMLPDTRDVSVEIFLRGSPSNRTLEPGEQLFMDIRVVTSRLLNGLFLVSVEALEGTALQLVASLRIEPLLPSLSINPPVLAARIVQGRSKVFQFNVTNFGRATANNVQSIIPDNEFISFISFGNTQPREGNLRLESGESALLSILIQTPANQQLGEIDTTIIITSNEAYTSLPITLIVSSDSLMNLTVVVEDEYTYFASGQPLVSDAVVTLINYDRNLRLTQSTDLGNGITEFINIYEDRYEMIVEAPSHRSLRQIIVTSVESPEVTVFIERQTVTYTWSVTPITFQDVYSISIEASFETRVPIPVVTVTPNEINLLELEADPLNSFQLNITNHGLIRADNVEIQFPNHPFLEFSTNTQYLGNLEPLSSVIVSINSTRRSLQKRNALNNLGNDLANAVNWAVYVIDVVHSYVCNEPQLRKTPVVLKQPTICDNQLDQPIAFSPGSGSGNVDGTAYYRPVNPGGGYNPGSAFGFDLGRPGDIPRVPSFSFLGYSSEPQPVFCNPCVSGIIGCLAPSPLELVFKNLPLAGCIPLILKGTAPTSSALNAAKWLQCTVGNPLTGLALCAYENGLYDTCTSSRSSNQNKRNIRRSVNEVIEALYPIHQSIALGTEVLGDEVWISVGDPRWLSTILRPTMADESETGVFISPAELSAILAAPPPNGTTTEMVANMVQRINNTLFGWNSGQLEPVDGSNIASFSTVQEFAQNIDTYNDIAVDKGFSSYIDAYNFASGQINQISDLEEEAGVCAVVRIRIQQELAITREAFLARLQIENMEDSPLEQLNIEIIITDLITGELSTSLFSIGNGSLTGSLSTIINDKWLLPSDAIGAVEWLIIPYSEAAPDSNRIYNVGGSLNYIVGGENITFPLSPTPITVMPDPSLLVHYFWERYVVADNPLTDVVEPSVPFTLGVAVKNAGYGTAYSLQISSAQPEIIDNERGLLISFMIIGANIGGERASPSLTVRFGDLAPNTTTVARWYMISSLQGEFMGYSATFENMNPFGDPKLSVLDDLQIHELIRNVVIYTSNEDDGIPDFLVNDRDDYLAYPDALYSSKTLQQYNVSAGIVLSVSMNSENFMVSSLVVRTLTNSTGWVYYRYEDTQGILNGTASSVNGTKREGNQTVILPSENSWITRDRDEASETETFYLHILDYVEVTDEVVFILDPCTVDCPTIDLPFTRPTVKLPTPSISVTAPMEVLYAGTITPLTLTCNVNIDPSLADNVDISVIWLRGTAQLSNATSRISISPLSESQSGVFTSILTVYPLSTADGTNFTCRAGIVPLSSGLSSTTVSDLGEGTALIVVKVPPIPIINIVASSNVAIVGESLNLVCSAMIVPDSLVNDPILMWSGPGVDQNSVQLIREDRNLSLSFAPLYTSHGGVYVCTARLAIPEAGIDVTGTQVMTIYAQIPPPIVTISGSPRDTDLFQGLDVTFTCDIELSPAVDSPVVVQGNWRKNATIIEDSSDGQITVANATVLMPPTSYQTIIRFNPMDFDDADTYFCSVTVIPQNETFIAGTSMSTIRNVTDISSFPPQNTTVTDEGVSIAGYSGYSLLCTAIRDQDLSSSTTISILWLDSNGLEVSGNQSTNMSSEGSANNDMVTNRLSFDSLLTSQAGEYTCKTAMTIPGTDILNYTVDETFIVTVKLPVPEAVEIFESRETPLHEGTSFSLNCVITLNLTGVDTDIEVQRSFIGPETSATVRIAQSDTVTSFNDIQLSLTFTPLIINDTGTYECSAIVRSIIPNVTASDPVMNDTTLFILRLPAPEVTIDSAVSLPISGDNHTLICSATTEDYLITSPILAWVSIEDIIDVSQATSVNSSTLALSFHPLHTSHGGSYTCKATLDIPEAGVNMLTNSNTENVTVQISTPVLSIADHPIPYNGTLFTLSGIASLDSSVDTDVTAVGIWSDDGSPQVTTSPPYQTNLEFRPLATDSLDEYILNVTFRSSDSSPFIIENTGSIVYSLIVQPLPPRPPIISVTSRYPSFDNDCGEARLLNCMANPVENLFSPPTITWLGPDGNEVPVGGDSNPMISPQTGQLIFSDITSTNSGQYVCRAAVNISVAKILNHFDDTTTNVNTNTPGPVTNLICNKSLSSSELSFSWEPPTVLGKEVTGYQVEVKQLQHRDGGTTDVVSVDITDFNTKLEEASLNEGLTGMVPYEIRVRAINLAGCGEQQYIYCFTQEGEPPSPKNVVVYKINSTALNVTWDKQTLVELKGLADYVVEYSLVVPNRRRQLSDTITVPWTESHVIITNLTPGAQYDVSVSVSTSVGISDPVRGMVKDVSTIPPSVADAKDANIGVIIGGVALALVFIIAVAIALTISVIVAVVVRSRRDEVKLRSSRSLPPAVSGKMMSSIKDSYENPCYDVKPEQQQQSSL